MTLRNNTPPYVGDVPDARRGYLTRWVTNLVINLMPPGARITDEPEVELEVTQKKGVDQAGRTFAQAAVVTSPGGSSTLSWEYVVPHAAYRTGASLRYVDSLVTQNTVNGFLLRTTRDRSGGMDTPTGGRQPGMVPGRRPGVPADRCQRPDEAAADG